jgi:membrane-bound inhibitor of C-type lysozyme
VAHTVTKRVYKGCIFVLSWLVASLGAWPQDSAVPGRPEAQAYVYECADGRSVVVDLKEGNAWVFLPDNTVRLQRVRSASGEKYSDGEAVFWSRGDEAMIDAGNISYRQCKNNYAKAIWENAKLRGNDFRGVGNEPGWVLEISSSTAGITGDVVFVGAYGQERHEFPASNMLTDTVSRKTTFSAVNERGDFLVILEGVPCTDSMSGKSFQTTVTVNLFGREYNGCGNPLH